MAEGYVKILSSILNSSIWAEPDDTVRTWLTLLAMADRDGYVGAAPSGIAHQTRTVSVDRVRELLDKFQQPDPESRTPDNEGRRLQKVDRGYLILNYRKIRDMHGAESTRAAKRKWWAENRSTDAQLEELEQESSSENSSHGSVVVVASGSVSSDSDAREPKPKRKPAAQKPDVPLPDDWAPSESHTKFAAENGIDLALEVVKFRGYADGRKAVSWNGKFSTWLGNAVGYARERKAPVKPSHKPPQPNDERNRYKVRGIDF